MIASMAPKLHGNSREFSPWAKKRRVFRGVFWCSTRSQKQLQRRCKVMANVTGRKLRLATGCWKITRIFRTYIYIRLQMVSFSIVMLVFGPGYVLKKKVGIE